MMHLTLEARDEESRSFSRSTTTPRCCRRSRTISAASTATHFRVIRVDSGDRALDVLRQVRLANEVVALLLVDQRMPGHDRRRIPRRGQRLFPDAKRALLTAYADTDAAIKAINECGSITT